MENAPLIIAVIFNNCRHTLFQKPELLINFKDDETKNQGFQEICDSYKYVSIFSFYMYNLILLASSMKPWIEKKISCSCLNWHESEAH